MIRSLRSLTLLIFALTVLMIPAIASANSQNTENHDLELRVRQIMGAAYEYQTLNSIPHRVGDSLKKDVRKAWGKPDHKSTVVAHYPNHHVSFYYDNSTKKEMITGIHDYGPQLSIFTLEELKNQIKETLYKDPIHEREVEGNYEVTYHANDTHNIIFIFESKFIYGNPKLLSYMLQPK